MVLPVSGPLSLSQINQEFGLGLNLAAYRGVVWYKPASNVVGNFSSGSISIQEFYGTNYAIVVNVFGLVYDFNLRAAVNAIGYNGTSPVTVICNVYGSIYGSSIFAPAFSTGSFINNGTQVILNVQPGALIVGRGGDGGKGWSWFVPAKPNGDQGGAAVELGIPTRIVNQGVIAGGGGGGGGSSTGASSQTYDDPGGSGGGGAGSIPGQPGGDVGYGPSYFGEPGTLTTGGAGGFPTPHGGSGEWAAGRNGGRGGDWGQPGQNGAGDYGFGVGGQAGYSIQNVGWLAAPSSLGVLLGRTDFAVYTDGNPNGSWNLYDGSPRIIETSLLVVHNSALPGPYTWDWYTASYGGVGLVRVDYVNEYTRLAVFQSSANAVVNYYSVFVFSVTAANGISSATAFGVTHDYYFFDPNPPPGDGGGDGGGGGGDAGGGGEGGGGEGGGGEGGGGA